MRRVAGAVGKDHGQQSPRGAENSPRSSGGVVRLADRIGQPSQCWGVAGRRRSRLRCSGLPEQVPRVAKRQTQRLWMPPS